MSKPNRRFFSLQAMKRLLRAGGAVHVSSAAAEKLALCTEQYAREISKRAVKNALFKGRRRIKKEDVEG